MPVSRKNRLRVLRAENDLTQIETARRAKMPETRYWRIENGYDEPSDDDRRALAKVLRVTESELGFDLPAEAAQ